MIGRFEKRGEGSAKSVIIALSKKKIEKRRNLRVIYPLCGKQRVGNLRRLGQKNSCNVSIKVVGLAGMMLMREIMRWIGFEEGELIPDCILPDFHGKSKMCFCGKYKEHFLFCSS